MDERRFDDLTKLVGGRTSRRTLVKGVAAAALAAAFGRTADDYVADVAVDDRAAIELVTPRHHGGNGHSE